MEEKQDHFALSKLRIAVFVWVLFGGIGLTYLVYVFFGNLRPENLLKSSALMLILGVFFFFTLWNDLHLNRSVSYGTIFPDLGLANHISIFRGLLIIALAGFVFYPVESSRFLWIPGILFLSVSLLDFADGAAARLTQRTTLLGERLDMRLDGAGVLFGSIILVMTGRAPMIFVLTGGLRYIYMLGQWIIQKSGKRVHSLPANPYRRALAGMMMGYISVTLFPFFSPNVTNVTAMMFLVPFLIGFGQDWLYTSGVISSGQGIKRPKGLLFDLFLTFLRIAAGCFLIFSPGFPTDSSNFSGYMFSLLTIIGFLPRVNALGVLVVTGSNLALHGSDPMLWVALVLACTSFFLGGGHFSIWSPEEWLIFHRVGDRA